MGKILQDLWILTESGTVLFSRVFEEKMDDQLFGSLLSALNMFANEIAEGGISSFELSSKKYALMRLNELLFVGNGGRKAKEKRLMAEIEKVAQRFFKKYGENVLKSWDNDVNQFLGFKNIINDTLEDPVEKFWDGF